MGFGLLTSSLIRQPLARRAARHELCALHVGEAETDAVVVAKIELANVPLQMLRANVLIYAIDAALQDRKVVFAAVHGCAATNVFADVVLNREVTGWEVDLQAGVIRRFVREHHCRLVDLLPQDRLQSGRIDLLDME